MLIDTVVDFCDRKYSSQTCTGCQSHHLCHQDCKNCLDDLHFHNNCIRTDYCCEHLLDYYVCRYSYKYCSEIIYALENIDLSRYPYFNILSLGCGASPDLMAFDYLNLSQPIKYKGFDINEYWGKIHSLIKEQFTGTLIEYYRGFNVLDLFDTTTIENCNVIIIEYLISFFYNSIGEAGLLSWFDKLANQIISYKPSDSQMLIVINDADSIHVGRDVFPKLRDSIERKGLRVLKEYRKRFKENNYYQNSERYYSCSNKFQIPNGFSDKYKVAIRCESAQLILEVE